MGAKPGKVRIDVLLVQLGLVESRTRAQALVMAGKVVVGDMRIDKPGTQVKVDSQVRLKGVDHPYVSRGGVKLAGALDDLGVAVEGLTVLDVGASTGGFSDCLLQRGASEIYALDVGRAQLHQKLRADPRVVVMERFNVRDLTLEHLKGPVDLAVFDLSFISLELAVRPVLACLVERGRLLLMVKPQFEVGRGQVGKGGIVTDDQLRLGAVDKIALHLESLGMLVSGRCQSRLPGAEGNVEFFLLAGRA